MVNATPLRVGLDAHVVGRRQTGNETYVIELTSALARRADVRPIAYVDRRDRVAASGCAVHLPPALALQVGSYPARITGPGQA